jgi:hypothetical protein
MYHSVIRQTGQEYEGKAGEFDCTKAYVTNGETFRWILNGRDANNVQATHISFYLTKTLSVSTLLMLCREVICAPYETNEYTNCAQMQTFLTLRRKEPG